MRINAEAKLSTSADGCPVAGISPEFNLFDDPYLAETYRSADRFIFGWTGRHNRTEIALQRTALTNAKT